LEQYPCLWRRSDCNYKKRDPRKYAVQQLAEALGTAMDENEIERNFVGYP